MRFCVILMIFFSELVSFVLSFYLALVIDDASKSKIEQIYLQHRHTMLWVAQNILHDHALAEDAVHDAFLRIISHLEKIFPENCNKTRSFVVIIVKNIAYDYLKKRTRHPELDFDEFEDYKGDSNSDPEETLVIHEGADEILDALGKLNRIYVDVLSLHVAYAFGDAEIAKMLGLSRETVRVRLYRGRKLLAELLQGKS
jgi:RNA polymerase sigma-70 factor, ECF subfamily